MTVYNTTGVAFNNYPIKFSVDTAALIATTDNQMQASMNDLRIFVNGRVSNRWLYPDSAGSSDTSDWFTINLAAKIEMTVLSAIGTTDTVTSITFEHGRK